jgi:tetraacyldisaccharide 4'-kinase
LLEIIYSSVARWRRQRTERWPETRRRLERPVISIGNLSVGGTGKTPVVAAVSRWLIERGERPSILSRGYKRRVPLPGVVVVSDGRDVRASLAHAGDEPLMLARAVPGAIVCVSEDRYLAGALAERQLGATVHVLDDGFQHLGLARDLDVLVTAPGEIPNGHVLPRGRLREPADAAARAHLLVVMDANASEASAEAWTLGVGEACGGLRRVGAPRAVGSGEAAIGSRITGGTETREGLSGEGVLPDSRVLLVAGIANPQRFADDVRAAGWTVVGELWFPDHHGFRPPDLARIAARLAESGAAAVFTTEKDTVRFEGLGPLSFPLYAVPLTVEFDPPHALFDRIATVLPTRSASRGAFSRAEACGDPPPTEGREAGGLEP